MQRGRRSNTVAFSDILHLYTWHNTLHFCIQLHKDSFPSNENQTRNIILTLSEISDLLHIRVLSCGRKAWNPWINPTGTFFICFRVKNLKTQGLIHENHSISWTLCTEAINFRRPSPTGDLVAQWLENLTGVTEVLDWIPTRNSEIFILFPQPLPSNHQTKCHKQVYMCS